MIKPQQVPSLFGDFRKITRDEFLLNAHIRADGAATRALLDITHPHKSVEARDRSASFFSLDNYKTFKAGIEADDLALFFCDEDMSGMIEMAAGSLTIEDTSSTSLVTPERGFCYFAEGIRVGGCVIHAISWAPYVNHDGRNGYLVTSYNDRLNEKDEIDISFWAYVQAETALSLPDSRWVYRLTSTYLEGEPMVPPKELLDAAQDLGEEMQPLPLGPGAILHGLMLMLQQSPEIIRVEKKKLENKKQLKRLNGKRLPSEVTVIDIRHKYESVSASSSTSPVNWSRRWLVSGHWRWQPMKDKDTGLPIRKRIWVMPYIKGPNDKPFIATKRVIALLK
jgi:hypothetical protein